MLEAEVETTILSELRSTVPSVGGNAQECRTQTCLQGALCKCSSIASTSWGYLCLCNLAVNYLCTSLPPKPQVPSSLSL